MLGGMRRSPVNKLGWRKTRKRRGRQETPLKERSGHGRKSRDVTSLRDKMETERRGPWEALRAGDPREHTRAG